MKEIKSIEEFNEIISNDFTIILAKGRNCSVCNPVESQLKKVLIDYKNIDVYKVYIDEQDSIRGKILTFTVPTVIIFSNGKELQRQSRFINFSLIKKLIEQYIN